MYIGKEEVLDLNASDWLILMNYMFLWKIKKFIEAYEPGCLNVRLLTPTSYPWSKPFVMVEVWLGPNVDHVKIVKRKINVKPSADCVWEFSYTFTNKTESQVKPHDYIPVEEAWMTDNTLMFERMMVAKKAGIDDIFVIETKNLKGCSDEVYGKICRLIKQKYNVNAICKDGEILCFLLDDEDILNIQSGS